MRRVAIIVGAWLGLLVAATAGYVRIAGDVAVERGRQRYAYREALKQQLRDAERDRPTVAWIGDSTMIGITAASYPQLVGLASPKISWARIAFFGSDFFTYYPVVGALLASHRPAVVVLLAHLRFFRQPASDATRGVTTRNDLLSWIPTAELGTAMRLPFEVRGMTIPRLLLARLLRYESLERALYLVDGSRALLAEAEVPWLGPNRFTHPMLNVRAAELLLRGSDVPITRNHPTVRMLDATVRMARRRGVRVIVLGYPVPRTTIGYDPGVYDWRFALLRDVVERAGGAFVDLHEAVPDAMLADPVGHLTSEGAKLLAERLRPVVAFELGRPSPTGPRALTAP